MTTPDLREHSQETLLSQTIAERRPTLRFESSPTSDQVLLAIVHAGMEVPSGFNLQPRRFIVVRNAEQKRRLHEAAMDQPGLKRPARSSSHVVI
jgi:nitroreductase